MGDIVHDVTEEATCPTGARDVEWENAKDQLIEWVCQDDEKGWRHHQPHPVHWQVVVDPVHEEMEGECDVVFGQVVVQMEQESVHTVLNQGPDKEPQTPEEERDSRVQMGGGDVEDVEVHRQPDRRHNPPWRQGERFQEVAEELRRALAVVSWPVDLVDVEVPCPVRAEHLHDQRLVQVQEVVFFEVFAVVRLQVQEVVGDFAELRQVRHPEPVRPVLGLHRHVLVLGEQLLLLLGRRQVAHQHVFVQHFVRTFRVHVGLGVLQDLRHVLACVLENHFWA